MSHVSSRVSGTAPGQRQLNGPQTSGREYRNLSAPTHAFVRDDDVEVPMRDGIKLLADVYRPETDGSYPVLIAASPYPRQIQDLGAPMGFIEAGASDFFVPRGYVHVSPTCAGPGVRRGPITSWTPRSATTCTTWSSGRPSSRGRTATSE